ncbi:MAG: mechanosensitive ion channel domain-containing protein, partial [Verrucomicrobiota bacterium]
KQVIESLTSPASGTETSTQSKQGASDQLTWVHERIQQATERSDLAKSEGFQSKVRTAGFPDNRPNEIQRDAAEAVDSWNTAKNLLEWIVVRETVGDVEDTKPTLPSNNNEALALERELEDLKNQLARFQANLESHPAAVARAEQESRSARHNLGELRVEADSPLAANARDRSDVDILEGTIREDNANAQVFFQKWLGYRLDLESREIKTRIDTISKLLADSGYGRLLTAQRATAEISRIEKNLPDLDKRDQQFSQDFDTAAARLAESRSKLDAATANGSAPPENLQKEAQTALAEYSLRESLRSSARLRAFAARNTLGLWNRVLELLKNTNLDSLEKARTDLSTQLPTTRDLAERIERVLSEKQAETEKWRQDLRMPDITQAERSALQDRIKKSQTLVEQLLPVRDESASLLALQNRLLGEIETEIAALVEQRRAEAIIHNLWKRIQGFWNFQITSQGDREVTLGTILTAILALIAALALARIAARRISTTVEHRLKLPGSRIHLVEKLSLYVLSVVFILMVLQWLQIPLTIFAFLGGALAVGIGFGSQNLINNFISGLLLLLEQKINVGDLVEVDGNFGRVTDLGSRCSSIRKFDGVEVLVPNSSLLEKNVINWTLSDPMHRFDFPVGVAYGSDVDLVMRTLHEAIDAQPEILRDPAPEVAFENFGESTLDFHVFFWLEVGTHNARDVGTQLRVLIARLFKERKIEMAFPQRDVHLIPSKPLEIRLQRES